LQDLDAEFMDPARDTVVSSLYKAFGGSSDKVTPRDRPALPARRAPPSGVLGERQWHIDWALKCTCLQAALYDEEDQLLIRSDIEIFPETPLGKRREAIAAAAGWYDGNPSFGKSLLEYAEETRKGSGKQFGTVTISAEELKKLRAEAAKK